MFSWEIEVPAITGDNSVAINAAIASLSANHGGGTVYLDPVVYTVAGSILRKSNVRIRGAFNGSGIWDAFSSGGTIAKWTGSSGGTVFYDAPGTDQKPVNNGGISDLTIDGGGLAANGLQSISTSYAEYRRIHCVGATSNSFYFGTQNTTIATLNYRNRLDSLSCVAVGGANGFVLDGVPGSGRNTCFMTASNLTVAFLNGCGFALLNADDCVFLGCSASLISGGSGGAGVYFGGTSDGSGKAANANQFYGFWTNGYINSAGGTYPSRGNIVYTSCMDGKPLIYQQSGSTVNVIAVDGEVGLNGFVRNPIPTG